MKRIPAVLAGSIGLFAALSPPALMVVAHDSLYHYVEIRLPGAGRAAEICLSVHAADLDGARALGADPAASDLDWLRGQDDETIQGILLEAGAFLAATFTLSVQEAGLDLERGPPVFPTPGEFRAENEAAEGARPGFLVASLSLDPRSDQVELRHSRDSGKRLLLVVNRPGAFPEIRDLAPGEWARISLVPSSP